jgi:multiple sugar transport system substrate-binding protein
MGGVEMRKATAVPAVLLSLALVTVVMATSAAQAKSSQVATVTLSGWSSSPEENELLSQVVATFNRTHKNVKIDYSVIQGDYPVAMTARFAAHNPPDVFYVDSSKFREWRAQGVLQPLNSHITRTKYNTKAFIPGLLNAFKSGKTIFGFPKDWSPLAMEINLAMLTASGAKVPTTWAQLRATAQRMASRNVVPNGKPICLPADWARMLPFVFQNKGSLANVQSPAVTQAVNYYVNLIKSGLAATPDKLGAGWCGEALGKQTAAIIFEGNWVLPYMKSTFSDVRYGAFPMVKGKTGGNLGFTVSYSMAKDAKNKQAAWTVLSWLTGRVGQRMWISKGLALPSRTDLKPVGGRKAFLAASPFVRGWGFPNFSETYTIMNNDLQSVIAGNKTVAEMLANVAASLKK